MLKRKYTARKNMMCVVGLGLSVVYDSDKEGWIVDDVLRQSGAHNKIKVGEFVRAIDGEDISETDKMSRVKELLKGEVGTPVTLQVSEGPNSELREVDVIRKQLWIPKPKEAQQKKEN